MTSMTCCPLSGGDGDAPSCFSSSTRKARKQHRCYECGDDITPGTTYEHVSGIWDGNPGAYKTCLSCVEIRDHFACENGFIFGALWCDLEDNFFPDMVAGGPCMSGLSPAAKQRLIDKRLAWYLANCEPAGARPPEVRP